MSIGPSSAVSQSLQNASISSRFVTSTLQGCTLSTPSTPLKCFANSSSRSNRLQPRPTLAPAKLKARAMAAPIPLLAPVTSATLPERGLPAIPVRAFDGEGTTRPALHHSFRYPRITPLVILGIDKPIDSHLAAYLSLLKVESSLKAETLAVAPPWIALRSFWRSAASVSRIRLFH